MDCLRSFTLNIRQVGTFSGASVKTWFVGAQEFWACNISGQSRFNIQGFKNIDLYAIKATGNVYTQIAALTGGVNVEDWSFDMLLEGNMPLVSGSIDTTLPNFWNIAQGVPAARTFAISKHTNEINFADPIKSLKFINFQNLLTQGTGGQTSGIVSLDYDLSFTFFYKYEGE